MYTQHLRLGDGSKDGQWVLDKIIPNDEHSTSRLMPSGCEAYARIFHPAYLVLSEHETHHRFQSENGVRWTQVANQNGKVPHAHMQWFDIVHPDGQGSVTNYQYGAPSLGGMSYFDLDVLYRLIARHLLIDQDFFFGYCEIRGFDFLFSPEQRSECVTPGPYGRNHFLVTGPLHAVKEVGIDPGLYYSDISSVSVQSPVAIGRVLEPVSSDADRKLFVPIRSDYQVPHVMWSTDHSFYMVSDVDLDSTFIGGSREFIDAIVNEPYLEAFTLDR